jgi:hypothetical protein
MKPYTFYLHDTVHPTPAFDFVHCDGDDEAIAHARMLLGRFPEYDAIEVYDGRSSRVTVRREPTASAAVEWAAAL